MPQKFLKIFVFFIISVSELHSSVDLINFEIKYDPVEGIVKVDWEVTDEAGVAAFRVYRSDSDESKGELVATISAVPPPFGDGHYSISDEPDSTLIYYYKLVEVSTTGEEVDIFKPSDDSNGDPNFVAFIKIFQQQENLTAGSTIVFNQTNGDGHQVSVSAISSDVGIVNVKQINTTIPFAPGLGQLSVYWHVQAITSDTLILEFSFTDADTMLYPGIAAFDSTTKVWTWLGGIFNSAEQVITLSTNVFNFFVPMGRHMCDFNLDNQVDILDFQVLGDIYLNAQSGHFSAGSSSAFFNYHQVPQDVNQIINQQDVDIFSDEFECE